MSNNIINAKFLEKGAFGKIYLLHLENPSKKLVLKKTNDSNKSKLSLDNEKKFNYLSHNNIIVAEKYDFGNIILKDIYSKKKIQIDNYLLFKYAPHSDLFEFTQTHSYYQYNIDNIAFQISDALNYLGNNSIVHGDLKLENILVFDYNHFKICDFGFALNINNDFFTYFKGSTPGIHGLDVINYNHVYKNTDVFSFGIILVELLNGRMCNGLKNNNDFKKILMKDNFPNCFLENIDVKYKRIIKKCLKLYPQDRIYTDQLFKEIKNINKKEPECSCCTCS